MDTALTWFIRVWVALAVVVNLISISGLILTSPSLWDGWQRVAEIYNPFNVWNVIMEVALFSPAVGAYCWREARRNKLKAQEN